MNKRWRRTAITVGIIVLVYLMTFPVFCGYTKPIVTRYGYPPHHWKEYEVSSMAFLVRDWPRDGRHPVVSLGLCVFRPLLLVGAELGLIPFDEIQA
ncbi:MAG: hypothetical protein WCP86_02795 [bacterium]